MKIIVLNLFLFAMTFHNLSYGQLSLGGKITDSASQRPLPLVTITLIKDSAVKQVTSSDTLGRYQFAGMEKGQYVLEFSYVTYEKLHRTLYLTENVTVDVALVPSYKELASVKLTARRPVLERTIDRLVFNVRNNINTVGTDVLELLSKTPQVRADGGGVTIIGKNDVVVMINDKPVQFTGAALAAYLRTLPAESVERIEVMTNPNASYSAAGSSGIVNIIIRRPKELGYSGSANLSLVQSAAESAYGGLNINYNKDKFRWYGNFNSGKGDHIPTATISTFYPDRIQFQDVRTKELSQFANGQVGMDVDVSPRSLLGASFNFFYSYPYQISTVRTSFINTKNLSVDSMSAQNNESKIAYRSLSSNIHYERSFDSLRKKRLVLDADWSSTEFDWPNTIHNDFFGPGGVLVPERSSATISNDDQTTQLYSLNGVVYLPGKNYSFSFGGRTNFVKNGQHMLFNALLADGSSAVYSTYLFRFNENTEALFANYEKDFGKKWSFQAGLRGEYTQTRGHLYGKPDSVHTNNYFYAFPTAYLLYKLNDVNTLSLNYGRRINRPSFRSLNPYRRYESQFQVVDGNPYLQPSISNNFELSEVFHDNLSVSVQYSYSNHREGIINLVQDTSSLAVIKYANYLSEQTFLVSTSYTIAKVKWWQSMNELDVYHSRSTSNSINTLPVVQGWGATFSSDNSFFFNTSKTVAGGLYFSYQFPDVSGLSKGGRYYFFDVSGKYLLWKNKLQLGVRLSDVLRSKDVTGSYIVNGILVRNEDNNDSRKFTISMRYNFGNNALRKGQSHSEETNKGRALN